MQGQTQALIYLFVILIFCLFILAGKSIRIVRPWEKGLIERLGRYQKTVDSGLNFILPFFENITKIDMREAVIDVPPQEVITSDNVVVTVDAVVYTEVTDPVKIKYNVMDFFLATIKLAQTNLRNLIGDMTLDASLTSRESINVKLRNILDEATDKWGVRVTRVELQRIEPPRDVTEAMHRQMKAERERRATVLEAEGLREAAVKKAEGSKEAQVLEADGRASAVKLMADADKYQKLTLAEGEGQAIETVFRAIHSGGPTNDLLAYKYLETLAAMANGQANKIFIPFEASALLSSIGSIAEMFKDKEGGKVPPKPAAHAPAPVVPRPPAMPGPAGHQPPPPPGPFPPNK